jgi:hypothetical protein
MNKIISILAAVAVVAPVAAFADESCTVHTDAVTHQEYRYQEQIDVDPTPSKSWVYIGQKTAWTTDTEVDGHAIDEEFSVGKLIKVTHRWHQTDERTVEDSPAKDEPCADNGGGSSAPSFGGGGGLCSPLTGYPECMKPVNYKYHGLPVPFGAVEVQFDVVAEQKKILLTQVVGILNQMIQYLKTH